MFFIPPPPPLKLGSSSRVVHYTATNTNIKALQSLTLTLCSVVSCVVYAVLATIVTTLFRDHYPPFLPWLQMGCKYDDIDYLICHDIFLDACCFHLTSSINVFLIVGSGMFINRQSIFKALWAHIDPSLLLLIWCSHQMTFYLVIMIPHSFLLVEENHQSHFKMPIICKRPFFEWMLFRCNLKMKWGVDKAQSNWEMLLHVHYLHYLKSAS